MLHSWFIDESLMILWRNIEVTAKISLQTLTIRNVFFKPNLRNIDVSLPLTWWFVDDALERHRRNIDNFVGNSFFIFFVFFCCVNAWIIGFSLLDLWRFVDDSLYKLRRYSEDFDANINDLLVFYRPNLRNLHVSSLLRRLLVDDSLERHIWNIDNFDGNFLILIVFLC